MPRTRAAMQQDAYLEIRTPDGDYQLPLGREPVTVGRHSQNQVVVNDKSVSRFHCVIEPTAEGFVIRDLGASNPTIVNGYVIQSALLSNGDVIAVGSTRVMLVIPGAPLPAPVVVPEEGEVVEAPSADLSALARAAGGSGAVEPVLTDADISALSVVGRAAPVEGEIETLTDADLVGGDADDGSIETLTDMDVVDEDESVVELTEADIIDDDPALDAESPLISEDGVIPIIASDDDEDAAIAPIHEGSADDEFSTYRRDLRILAENAPQRPFAARDIVLVDPRGETVASGHAGRGERGREILDLLREILIVAFRSRATDVHLDPKGNSHLLRLRIDGVMMDAASLPPRVGEQLSGLVKVAAGIDPLQKAAVQEGRFIARVPAVTLGSTSPVKATTVSRNIDHRVSFAQTFAGQKWVIRILDSSGVPARVKDLKLPSVIETELLTAMRPEPGMILVCGSAGSGKTTTLYAMVRSIDLRRRNVIALEDPVESQIEGVSQLPVEAETGQSFASVLRSVLRQDPDVIFLSEIRDPETARLAIQAAASGRLILSSIGANDTMAALGRVIDMGLDRYLLAQGLRGILSQRLIRELCPRCKKPVTLPAELLNDVQQSLGPAIEASTYFGPKGCPSCFDTGYSGRRAVCEMLIARPPFQDAVRKGASMEELRVILSSDPQSVYPMKWSIYSLLAEGRTSASEAERVLSR